MALEDEENIALPAWSRSRRHADSNSASSSEESEKINHHLHDMDHNDFNIVLGMERKGIK